VVLIVDLEFRDQCCSGSIHDAQFRPDRLTMKAATYCPFNPKLIGLFVGFAVVLFALVLTAHGQVEGFTEPFRSVDLSSDETGIIFELSVEEGDFVEAGDMIARLDDRVQRLQLELAQHLAKSKSALLVAEKTYEKRVTIQKRIEALILSNNASQSELIRAEMETTIAKSELLAATEELATREIEQRRTAAQLARRTIVAPFSGTIGALHRSEGEFVSPARPEVVSLVQLDKLFAKFNVPSSTVTSYEVGQEVEVSMANGTTVVGQIFSIGIQTDAQSGTVEIKLVIDNTDGEIRSGEICTLNV